MQKKWEEKAKEQLKKLIKDKKINYQRVSENLQKIGVTITSEAISNKISRGTFSYAFFLQCEKAIYIDQK